MRKSKPQPTFFSVFDKAALAPSATGQAAAAECEAHAVSNGWNPEVAGAFILDWLRAHGPTAGEVLVTEASKDNQPHDLRAFGAVFLRLSKKGLIEKCGYVQRVRGHNSAGGLVWKLSEGK